MPWDPHREAWAGGPPPWLVQEWARADGLQTGGWSSLDDARLRKGDAQKRVERALIVLAERGNPWLQAREVPGRWQRPTPVDRLLGRSGRIVRVAVEPAWPLGRFQWEFRQRSFSELETGYTPTGRVVPMLEAVSGDDVDEQLCHQRLGTESRSSGKGRPLTTEHIADTLERYADTK